METPKKPKYSCEKCRFLTNNKKDFFRHNLTLKHQNGVIGNTWKHKKPLTCFGCDKKYNSRSGLYKHHRVCDDYTNLSQSKTEEPNMSDTDDGCGDKQNDIKHNTANTISDEKVDDADKEEKTVDMYKLLLKYCKTVDELIPRIGNTTNHITNNINVHVYLTETCKDAIDLPEFIENIQLQLSDLTLANESGLLHSTKNIFLKELQNTEQVKRPIQCTDIKRKILYIKEDGSWCKDVGNEKVKGAIHNLSQKHMPLVNNWHNKEGGETTEDNNLEYVQVVKSASQNVLEESRGVQSALREICKETYMKADTIE